VPHCDKESAKADVIKHRNTSIYALPVSSLVTEPPLAPISA
jgi:hypothetical protein